MPERAGATHLDAARRGTARRGAPSYAPSRWVTLVALTTWLLAGLPSIGQPVWACDCDLPGLVAQLEAADAAFAGEVTDIREDGRDSDLNTRLLAIDLDVSEIWRGDVSAQTVAHTEDSGASCGYTFKAAESYLVFVREDDRQRLRASLCSRTAPLDEATTDLEALGPGSEPREARPDPSPTAISPTSDGSEMPSAVLAWTGFALVAVTVVGVVTWRRRA